MLVMGMESGAGPLSLSFSSRTVRVNPAWLPLTLTASNPGSRREAQGRGRLELGGAFGSSSYEL